MNIRTRLAKVENGLKIKNMINQVGIIQVNTNKETGKMEIKDRDKLVFSGSSKNGKDFIANLKSKYEVLIIDDIPRWKE